jgi:CMP-N,N'-diacetyllegionaminic acid synthase
MNIVAVIPARSGSKSIPNKNIMSIGGKPMLAYSIEHAQKSKYINRIIVSTDSDYYGDIAKSFGAEVPFLRPAHLAQDMSTDLEVFEHALRWLQEHERYQADVVVHLRPTTPVRNPADVDKMIEMLINDISLDSVRSVSLAPETPYKMWTIKDNKLHQVAPLHDVHEPYNQPRQSLPPVYLQNASIDVFRGKTILELNSMNGKVIGAYVMETNGDIDYITDLHKVKSFDIKQTQDKTFVFDIDGVIAQLSPNNDYNLSQPNTQMIEKVNQLYDQGNTIVLFTARGSKTGLDWMDVTRSQMIQWGVKFHELRLGKPAADYYVDDRMLDIYEL